MTRWMLASIAVAGALALRAQSPALAATRELTTSTDWLGRPALAGDRLIVSAARPSRPIRLLSVGPGGGAVTLFAAPRRGIDISYAASDQRVAAVATTRPADNVERYELLSGPPDGPLARVALCNRPEGLAGPPAPAVEGEVAAWAGAGCSLERILVIDGTSAPEAIEARGRVLGLAVAGRYVAWLAARGGAAAVATVYDRATRSVAYSVDAGTSTLPVDVDVHDDGTAVVASYRSAAAGDPPGPCGALPMPRITWHSVADPSPHDVGADTCEPSARLAFGRLAFLGNRPDRRGSQLVLTDLSGGAAQPVAVFEALFGPDERFDWDGSRIAWSDGRCRDHAVLARHGADGSPPSPATSCPVRASNLRLRRDGTAHVRISCPNGCRADRGSGLQVFAPRWLHVVRQGRRSTTYARAIPFNLRPGGRATLRLALTARQRAIARRKRRVEIRLKAVGQHVYQPRMPRILFAR